MNLQRIVTATLKTASIRRTCKKPDSFSTMVLAHAIEATRMKAAPPLPSRPMVVNVGFGGSSLLALAEETLATAGLE